MSRNTHVALDANDALGSPTISRETRDPAQIVAIFLILAGIVGLVVGGFSYTRETHDAKIGPLELSLEDPESVNIPVWAGVGAIVGGGMLLFVRGKRLRGKR